MDDLLRELAARVVFLVVLLVFLVDDLLVLRLLVLFFAVLRLFVDLRAEVVDFRLLDEDFFLAVAFLLVERRLLFFSGNNSSRKKSRSLGLARTSKANIPNTIKNGIIFPCCFEYAPLF